MSQRKAFTLIELLIVVAIIAILAAIAVPNFLEAQVRAKVSRARADMRSINLAAASYVVDYNALPLNRLTSSGRFSYDTNGFNYFGLPNTFSTPVAYISNVLLTDPFAIQGTVNAGVSGSNSNDHFYNYEGGNQIGAFQAGRYHEYWILPVAPTIFDDPPGYNNAVLNPGDLRYCIWSIGPDQTNGYMSLTGGLGTGIVYDPTNGTTSNGDIGDFYIGGAVIRP